MSKSPNFGWTVLLLYTQRTTDNISTLGSWNVKLKSSSYQHMRGEYSCTPVFLMLRVEHVLNLKTESLVWYLTNFCRALSVRCRHELCDKTERITITEQTRVINVTRNLFWSLETLQTSLVLSTWCFPLNDCQTRKRVGWDKLMMKNS